MLKIVDTYFEPNRAFLSCEFSEWPRPSICSFSERCREEIRAHSADWSSELLIPARWLTLLLIQQNWAERVHLQTLVRGDRHTPPSQRYEGTIDCYAQTQYSKRRSTTGMLVVG